jgi:hypothetical protein
LAMCPCHVQHVYVARYCATCAPLFLGVPASAVPFSHAYPLLRCCSCSRLFGLIVALVLPCGFTLDFLHFPCFPTTASHCDCMTVQAVDSRSVQCLSARLHACHVHCVGMTRRLCSLMHTAHATSEDTKAHQFKWSCTKPLAHHCSALPVVLCRSYRSLKIVFKALLVLNWRGEC